MLGKLREWWERRETSGLRNPQQWLKDAFGIEETYAGVDVTTDSALRCTAVFAAVRVLSESIAGLPLHLYRRDGDARERATDHPLYSVLHDQPNTYQTSFEFRQLLMVWLCLHGNAYAEIIRDTAGNVTELWPIRPDLVTVKAEGGALAYEVYFNTERSTLPAERVLHLRGLSTDGIMGLSPIAAARQSIGGSLAAEKHGALYFSQGLNVGGVVEMPQASGPDSAMLAREKWKEVHHGLPNFFKTAFLYGGAKFVPFKLNNVDSQWLETRRFGVEDICRLFRVPNHMLADLSKANYSNVDALDRQFAKYSCTPWTGNIEQAMGLKLLGPRQRNSYFIEHDYAGLFKGDPESEMRQLQAAIYSGILNPNGARRVLNLPPREGGDVYLQPTNVAPSPYNPHEPEQQPRSVKVVKRDDKGRMAEIHEY